MTKREVIKVPNAPKHGDNPIPICVRMGNQIFPSVIRCFPMKTIAPRAT